MWWELLLSAPNAALFAAQFFTWASANHIQAFYFEAFDEAWKATSEAPQEGHWGIWDTTGATKPGMDAFFNGQTVPASCTASPCDLNVDGSTNVLDVQLIINEALGVAAALHDVNQDGAVNVLDIQIVINAALGMSCRAN